MPHSPPLFACLAFYLIASTQAFAVPTSRQTPSLKFEFSSSSSSLYSSSAPDAVPTKPKKSWLHRLKSKMPTRGSHYGNSTILTPNDAAVAVGVKPTLEASKWTWQSAWRVHRFLLPFLHYGLWDRCRMKDSKLALAVLWWKAIAGNDASSPVNDSQLSYDLLPPITRSIVHPVFCRFYPRLHHANVEIRTAYLDKAVSNIIATICSQKQFNMTQETNLTNIRLIVMGGGYDTRSFKLLERHSMHNTSTKNNPSQSLHGYKQRSLLRSTLHRKRPPNPLETLPSSTQYNLQCFELDLPEVVRTKRKLIQSRLLHRRPWLNTSTTNLTLLEVDLNDLDATRSVLEGILSNDDRGNGACNSNEDVATANIIIFEGVMIYLNPGVPHSLLELCNDVLQKHSKISSSNNIDNNNNNRSSNNYLCFADRLDNIPGGDEELARVEMEETGWELMDWLSKPGLARHMGVATLRYKIK